MSGALVQDWAGAADGKVSGVTKVMLTARARAVEIDRSGIVILLGVSGRSDQGGRIRHEKWGKGKSFVELLLGVVILESETRHVPSQQPLHPHSVLALESSYAGSRQASKFTSECDSRHTFQTGLEVRSYPKQQILSNVEAASRWLEACHPVMLKIVVALTQRRSARLNERIRSGKDCQDRIHSPPTAN